MMRYRRDKPIETSEGMKRILGWNTFHLPSVSSYWRSGIGWLKKTSQPLITLQSLKNTWIGAVPSSLSFPNRHYLDLDKVLGMTTAEKS